MNKILFQTCRTNFRNADRIIHKINTDFTAVSPWKMNKLSDKLRGGKFAGAPIYQEKLHLLRDYICPDFMSDYKYAAKILESVKRFNTANCKEFSEIGYLIAKVNNIENCYCANLYASVSAQASKMKDFGHSVMLITPKKLDNIKFGHKYYVDDVSVSDTVVPDNRTILIDPLFGIVDYWKNALQKYSTTPLNKIASEKEVRASIREPLLSSDKDIKKIKKNYPLLSFDDNSKKIKWHYRFREIEKSLDNYYRECFPKFYENYPVENPKPVKQKLIDKISFYLRKCNIS